MDKQEFCNTFYEVSKLTFIDWLAIEGYCSQIPYNTQRFTARRLVFTEAAKWLEKFKYFHSTKVCILTPAGDIVDAFSDKFISFPQGVFELATKAAKDAEACGHTLSEILDGLHRIRKWHHDDWDTDEDMREELLAFLDWGKDYKKIHYGE